MLADHERTLIKHPRILEFHKFFSEYQIWFEAGTETFKVTFRMYETQDGRFFFVQSHMMHTPEQRAEVSDGRVTHEDAATALAKAVSSITTYYDSAVAAGHPPSLDWFRPNTAF